MSTHDNTIACSYNYVCVTMYVFIDDLYVSLYVFSNNNNERLIINSHYMVVKLTDYLYHTFETFFPSVILFLTVSTPHYVFSHVRQTADEVPCTLDQREVCYIPNDMILCIIMQPHLIIVS